MGVIHSIAKCVNFRVLEQMLMFGRQNIRWRVPDFYEQWFWTSLVIEIVVGSLIALPPSSGNLSNMHSP
ncbi:hypothetical protein BFX83_10235 [Komagataeibacter xylinus]|nr:hypothetical protein BFX83_10235 [Komagataeibacter xylinus]